MKRIIFILSIFMIAISCNSLSTSENRYKNICVPKQVLLIWR